MIKNSNQVVISGADQIDETLTKTASMLDKRDKKNKDDKARPSARK